MWIKTNELPEPVRAALLCVDYHRVDVEVKVASSLVMSDCGADGRRAFVIMIDLATGLSETTMGSWGGPNAFNPQNLVDNDHKEYALPDTAVIVRGSMGYPQTFAQLHVSPALVAKMLPPAGPDLTDEERDALYCHASIKGGQYRREELHRRRVRPETLDRMVQAGYLSENRAGARQITTAGRNALGEYRGY